MMIKTFLLTLWMTLVTVNASAGLLVDFSLGPKGNLGTSTITQGTVAVEAAGGNLYRFRDSDLCCDHDDLGLGVLGPNEHINPAEPELNVGEWIKLTLPGNHSWDKIYFTSVNDLAFGHIWANGQIIETLKAGEGQFTTGQGFVTLDGWERTVKEIYIIPSLPKASNFFLLWQVDLRKGDPIDPVPEPMTLLTLGTGLLYGVWRAKKPPMV